MSKEELLDAIDDLEGDLDAAQEKIDELTDLLIRWRGFFGRRNLEDDGIELLMKDTSKAIGINE